MRLVLVCSLFTITPTLIVADHPVAAGHQPDRLRGEAGQGLLRGGAGDRRAGAARPRGGNPARHRRISAPLQAMGIDGIRDAQRSPAARAADRGPSDDRSGRHRRRQGSDRPRRSRPAPRGRGSGAAGAVALAGGQPGAAGPDRSAERRLLRDAAFRRRAALPGHRPCRRPQGRRLHQEHRVRRLVLFADRAGDAAQPARHLPGLRRHRLPDAAGGRVARHPVRLPPHRADRRPDGWRPSGCAAAT